MLALVVGIDCYLVVGWFCLCFLFCFQTMKKNTMFPCNSSVSLSYVG